MLQENEIALVTQNSNFRPSNCLHRINKKVNQATCFVAEISWTLAVPEDRVLGLRAKAYIIEPGAGGWINLIAFFTKSIKVICLLVKHFLHFRLAIVFQSRSFIANVLSKFSFEYLIPATYSDFFCGFGFDLLFE